jgi:large subunit ribosomal protein L24
MSIRKDDTVAIIAGDDAGRTGRVLRLLHDKNRIVVEGINRVYRHVSPSRRNPQGGRLTKEMPVDISNVQLYCPNCRHGVRVGRRYAADGHKERYCKKCSNSLGVLSPPRKAYAKEQGS